MSVTAESFIAAYPEFASIHDEDAELVALHIARAEALVGDTWRSDIRDQIVELRVAHRLAMSPAGRNAKLSEPGAPTAYERDLKCLMKGNAFAKLRIV